MADSEDWWRSRMRDFPEVGDNFATVGVAAGLAGVFSSRHASASDAGLPSADDVRGIMATIPAPDMVNHPPHYTAHPSGIECIQIVRHMGFNLGNVVKYVWRADLKGDAIEDLKKALVYLQDEIAKREGAGS